MKIGLIPRKTPGAMVDQTANGWRLGIPAGGRQTYRLAQLDDYAGSSMNRFKHAPLWAMWMHARLSAADLPGTWGFGLWNDPFGFSFGFGDNKLQLPTLPQVAWFMHASSPNWLSLCDRPLPGRERAIPGNGFFSGVFCSSRIPSMLLAPAILGLPLFEIRPTSRILRRLATRVICQDAMEINVDVTQWHEYSIQWWSEGCMFTVDGSEVLFTPVSPRPPLGLIIWIDNQFAAWTPEGRLGYGTLENPTAWLEIEKLKVSPGMRGAVAT